jgi:multiple sugar transport system substrate-binding protein
MQFGGDAYEPSARELVATFMREHPDIKVEYRLVPWTNFYEVFSTAVASGTTPDVSTGAAFQGFEFSQAVAPVDDIVARWEQDGTAEAIVPSAIDAQQDDQGKYTALPWGVEIRTIHYRKDMLKRAGIAPPASLQQLGDAARALTGGGRYGLGFTSETLGSQMLMSLFQNNGGGIFDAKCGPGLLNDRNREVCRWVQDLVRDGAIPKAAAGWGTDDLTAAMQNGDVAMAINTPNWFRQMGDAEPEMEILSPPTGFHGDKGALIWYMPIFLYESAGQEKPEAEIFLEWWLDNGTPLWEKGGIASLPARPAFYDEVDALEDPRVLKIRDEWVPVGRTFPTPCDHGIPSLNKIEGQGFLQTLTQDVLTLKDVDASLEQANSVLTELSAA